MELEELMQAKGNKVVDSNMFFYHKESSVIEDLYDCKNISEFPVEKILKYTDLIRSCGPYFLREDVFTMHEVAKEMDSFLLRINNSIRFFSDKKYVSFSHSYGPRTSRKLSKLKRLNKHRAKQKTHRKYDEEHNTLYDDEHNVLYDGRHNALNTLNVLGRELNNIIRLIKSKEIMPLLTEGEVMEYNKYLEYFVHVADKHHLKWDTSQKYPIKSRKPCDFQTDEKIVAAAFTLANRNDSLIISSDYDIFKIMNFFKKDKIDKMKFGIDKPKCSVSLYSDLGSGYQVQVSL